MIKNKICGDACAQLAILQKTDVEVVELAFERDWDKANLAATFADCLVDALLGIGFHDELTGSYAQLVKIINSAAKPVVAVDIPSGIDTDTGQIRGMAARASHTVTFGLLKPGNIATTWSQSCWRSIGS